MSENITLQTSALQTSALFKFQKSSIVWVTERIMQISSLLPACFIELETPLKNFIIMTSVFRTERIVQISSLLTACFIELETPLQNFMIMTSVFVKKVASKFP